MHAVYLPSSGSPHFSSTHLLLGLCTPKSSHLKLANPRAGLFVDRKGNRALESLRPIAMKNGRGWCFPLRIFHPARTQTEAQGQHAR